MPRFVTFSIVGLAAGWWSFCRFYGDDAKTYDDMIRGVGTQGGAR